MFSNKEPVMQTVLSLNESPKSIKLLRLCCQYFYINYVILVFKALYTKRTFETLFFFFFSSAMLMQYLQNMAVSKVVLSSV